MHKKVAQKSCTRKLIPDAHPPRGPPKNYILCAYPYALAHKLMRSRRTFPAKFISYAHRHLLLHSSLRSQAGPEVYRAGLSGSYWKANQGPSPDRLSRNSGEEKDPTSLAWSPGTQSIPERRYNKLTRGPPRLRNRMSATASVGSRDLDIMKPNLFSFSVT